MYSEDTGNRSTAYGLEAGTPETAATTTTIWTFGGEEVPLPTGPQCRLQYDTRHLSVCLSVYVCLLATLRNNY